MVQLVEVPDEHFEAGQPGHIADDDEFVDTDSEISEESDYDPVSESLADRLASLKDMIPPTTRGWLSARLSQAVSAAQAVTWFSARTVYVVSTSAILVGVPWALAYAEEQNLLAMEQEYRMREMGGELLTAGADGANPSTADRVGAVLGKEGAKPAL